MTEMPDIREMSDAQIVDAYGELNETIKKMSKDADYLKEALKARDGDIFEGATYKAVVTTKSRAALDTARLKLEMGPEWYEEHCKTTTYKQLNVSRRES